MTGSNPFSLEGALEIIKPHNDRILAEARLAEAEDRLKAANRIIAEQVTAIASAHAVLRQIEGGYFPGAAAAALNGTLAEKLQEIARAELAKIEGRA
jgi:uncharacterized coiled-coil protein SlyX